MKDDILNLSDFIGVDRRDINQKINQVKNNKGHMCVFCIKYYKMNFVIINALKVEVKQGRLACSQKTRLLLCALNN